jgi:hypothetical protein
MPYQLDSNTLVAAKNRYYGFSFCPAYWEWILRENEIGKDTLPTTPCPRLPYQLRVLDVLLDRSPISPGLFGDRPEGRAVTMMKIDIQLNLLVDQKLAPSLRLLW